MLYTIMQVLHGYIAVNTVRTSSETGSSQTLSDGTDTVQTWFWPVNM